MYLTKRVNHDSFLPFKKTCFFTSGLWNAIKKIANNTRFVLVVLSWSCEWFKISSVSTFIVKYLEVGFGKSAGEGSFLIGQPLLELNVKKSGLISDAIC